MTRWSESDLQKKGLANNGDGSYSKSGVVSPVNSQGRKIKLSSKKHFCTLKFLLRERGIEYQEEFRFHPKRKWRFDLCIPAFKIAFEYDGLAIGFNEGGKSRHTSIQGFTNDATKINAATILGWRVLRYTALNEKDAVNDFLDILKELIP